MTIVIEGSKGTLAADDMHLIMNVVVVRKSKHKKILLLLWKGQSFVGWQKCASFATITFDTTCTKRTNYANYLCLFQRRKQIFSCLFTFSNFKTSFYVAI